MSESGKIVLVDAYSQIYRSFYAIRGLTNAQGEANNALFGMARFLLSLEERFSPEHGAVVFDRGVPSHRLELIPEYKATRPPMPEDLRSQLLHIRHWIEAFGWPILEREATEADDLIAGVVSERSGREVVIISQDKDLAQLVDDGVVILTAGKKGASDELDRTAVEAKFGVPPEAIVDYLALVGDSVDNIPGVPGVGARTAARLLHEFGSIDVILEKVDTITRPALRESLRQSAEILQRNRAAVRLHRDLPEAWDGMASLQRRRPDWDTLLSMAREQGFKSLVTALAKHRDAAQNPGLFPGF